MASSYVGVSLRDPSLDRIYTSQLLLVDEVSLVVFLKFNKSLLCSQSSTPAVRFDFLSSLIALVVPQ